MRPELAERIAEAVLRGGMEAGPDSYALCIICGLPTACAWYHANNSCDYGLDCSGIVTKRYGSLSKVWDSVPEPPRFTLTPDEAREIIEEARRAHK